MFDSSGLVDRLVRRQREQERTIPVHKKPAIEQLYRPQFALNLNFRTRYDRALLDALRRQNFYANLRLS